MLCNWTKHIYYYKNDNNNDDDNPNDRIQVIISPPIAVIASNVDPIQAVWNLVLPKYPEKIICQTPQLYPIPPTMIWMRKDPAVTSHPQPPSFELIDAMVSVCAAKIKQVMLANQAL